MLYLLFIFYIWQRLSFFFWWHLTTNKQNINLFLIELKIKQIIFFLNDKKGGYFLKLLCSASILSCARSIFSQEIYDLRCEFLCFDFFFKSVRNFVVYIEAIADMLLAWYKIPEGKAPAHLDFKSKLLPGSFRSTSWKR